MTGCPDCPSDRNAPHAIEGWQAWQVAARVLVPRVVGEQTILALDTGAALAVADALGFDARAVLLLLPAIEAGLVEARDGPVGDDSAIPL